MMTDAASQLPILGRCYCGATEFRSSEPPTVVVYCHCSDCRRSSGAPVSVFAGFRDEATRFTPNAGHVVSPSPSVARRFCGSCGSPLSGRYDYLSGMVFVPVGLLDRPDDFPPTRHAHFGERLHWLDIDDDLERDAGSARERLGS